MLFDRDELTFYYILEESNLILEFLDIMEENVTNINVILPANRFHCKTKASICHLPEV